MTPAPFNSNSSYAFEQHYTVAQLAQQWRMSYESVRLIVKSEPGVIRLRMGLTHQRTHYSVPQSVARRIHSRLTDPAAAA
jgi:hypothetical protein